MIVEVQTRILAAGTMRGAALLVHLLEPSLLFVGIDRDGGTHRVGVRREGSGGDEDDLLGVLLAQILRERVRRPAGLALEIEKPPPR